MTREEIMALSERELEIAVGREVMGYTIYSYHKGYKCASVLWDTKTNTAALPWPKGADLSEADRDSEAEAWGDMPRYTTDANALRDMELEIGQIKLGPEYIRELNLILYAELYEDYAKYRTIADFHTSDPGEAFCLKVAPMEDCCRAALLAMMEKTK